MGPAGELLVVAALDLAGVLLGPRAANGGLQRRLWFMLALVGCFVLAGPATSAFHLSASISPSVNTQKRPYVIT
ncbi:MAG: hypothetical protein GY937_20240 [bacterium]|nr:hypothetical protein [bacterium]